MQEGAESALRPFLMNIQISHSLNQESFRQTRQKDLKVLLLGHAHGRVLILSSQEDIGCLSLMPCTTVANTTLLDASCSLIPVVRAVLMPLEMT